MRKPRPNNENGKFIFLSYPHKIDDLAYKYIEALQKEAPYLIAMEVVDVSKIPENVVFHLDPNMEGGIWTSDNIPPSVIRDWINLHN